jgi:hypothetical protein
MKIAKLAMASAMAALLAGGTTFAQEQSSNGGSLAPRSENLGYESPSSKLVAYEYDEYKAPEGEPASPSDVPVAPVAPAAAPAQCNNCQPCSNGCYTRACNKWLAKCDTGSLEGVDQWHLIKPGCFMQKWGLDFGGWVAQGYVANPQSPGDRFNGPVTWMDRSNEYMLNEVYTYLKRETNTEGDGWDLGFRIDTLYGESAKFDTSAGLEDRINKSQAFYGLAIPQAYAEVAYNDLKVKVGHFISPVGYYTVGTYNNFFNTIPYTYQYGEPFTHTGALATYNVSENWILGGGFTRGWDNTGNFNHHLGTIFTAIRNNIFKQGDSFAYVNMWSQEPNSFVNAAGVPQFSNRYFQTCVYSCPVSEKITYVFQSDFGVQGSANTFSGNSTARWYGVNQYIYYKVSDKWSWGYNYEWFRDESGFRVGGFLPDYTNNTNGGPTNTRGLSPAISGFAGNFYQMTMGPRWTPNKNFVIRPNLRFDWYQGGSGANGNLPYDAGHRRQQGILMTDFVIAY